MLVIGKKKLKIFDTCRSSIINPLTTNVIHLIEAVKKPSLSSSFSPITFTNVEISTQNFMTFSLNPFATQV